MTGGSTRWPALPVADTLVLADPVWSHPGLYVGGVAHLRVWTTTTGGHLAVVTEQGMGVSVTNAAEDIHSALVGLYGPGVVHLEHYPTEQRGGDDPTLDQVAVVDGRPRWRRVWPVPPGQPRPLRAGRVGARRWRCRAERADRWEPVSVEENGQMQAAKDGERPARSSMIGRRYLDPGDRLAGRHRPPLRVTVVARWGPGGGPRNVLVQREDGTRYVVPFVRRLRVDPCPWWVGDRVVWPHREGSGRRRRDVRPAGTVTAVNLPHLPAGVEVTFDEPVNGSLRCYATHSELRAHRGPRFAPVPVTANQFRDADVPPTSPVAAR